METAYNSIQQRLMAQVPELKMIDLDSGQIDDPENNYPLLSPSVFMRITVPQWESIGEGLQEGKAEINLRVVTQVWESTGSIAPENVRQKGLQHLGLPNKIQAALQGFIGENFNALERISTVQDDRMDGLLVFNITYNTLLRDTSGMKQYNQAEDVSLTVTLQE